MCGKFERIFSFYFFIDQNFASFCQVFQALGLTFMEEYGGPVVGQRLCPLRNLGHTNNTKSRTMIVAWRGNRNQDLRSSGRINKTHFIVLGVYINCMV